MSATEMALRPLEVCAVKSVDTLLQMAVKHTSSDGNIQMAQTEDDLPVLSDVIRTGNKDIIRSTRWRRAVNDQLDELCSEHPHFDIPDHLMFEPLAENTESADDNKLMNGAAANPAPHISDEALESLIDDIIDKHMLSLRLDLRTLLEQATNPSIE